MRIDIQGFLNNNREVRVTTSEYVSHSLDGYMLDEVQLNVTIKSTDDIETLIAFLECTKPCFFRHKKQK